jgi:hypothetical protein
MERTKQDKLKNLVERAYDFLNKPKKEIGYNYYKDKIKKLFQLTQNNQDKELYRLIVIDNLYSTSMNKIGNPFKDLSADIKTISKNDLREFLHGSEKGENTLLRILNKQYGYNAKNPNGMRTISLISKYAYFLADDYEFPIYDKHVKSMARKISKIYKKKRMDFDNPAYFFHRIDELCEESGVLYDKFDSFCWLYGKYKDLFGKTEYDASIGHLSQYEKFIEDVDNFLKEEII